MHVHGDVCWPLYLRFTSVVFFMVVFLLSSLREGDFLIKNIFSLLIYARHALVVDLKEITSTLVSDYWLVGR